MGFVVVEVGKGDESVWGATFFSSSMGFAYTSGVAMALANPAICSSPSASTVDTSL